MKSGFLLVSALAAVSGFSVSVRSPAARMRSLRMSSEDYTVAILGDLHLDPRYMDVRGDFRGHIGRAIFMIFIFLLPALI